MLEKINNHGLEVSTYRLRKIDSLKILSLHDDYALVEIPYRTFIGKKMNFGRECVHPYGSSIAYYGYW